MFDESIERYFDRRDMNKKKIEEKDIFKFRKRVLVCLSPKNNSYGSG